MAPRVSVVTPFYNTADFLQQCIESVLAQSHRDFEYVLLDNCSTDGSTEIARKFAQEDPRIRLERNDELLPQLANYNRALSLIAADTGWCKIVQADDWIFPNCLEEMVRLGESDASVGIVSSYRLVGKEVKNDGVALDRTVLPGLELCRHQLLGGPFLFGSPTSLLFRAEVVRARAPFFEEMLYHADTAACYEILRSWNLGFVSQVLTFSRVDDSSIRGRVRGHQPNLLDGLMSLRRFGPEFLTEDEMSERWRTVEHRYLCFLGDACLEGRDGKFWEYHRRGLALIDYPLGRTKLLRYALRQALRRLTGPFSLLALLLRRLLGGRSPTS